jgi:hypothetical protein
MEYILDVLFLRNADIYDALIILLEPKHQNAAELLLRPLLEGIVIFEWCMRDPHPRALRFKRTCFESTLDLLENGYLKRSPRWVKRARDAVVWLESEGHKPLPNMRQMIDSTPLFKEGVGYNFYKLLAKKAHGFFESWAEYDPTQQDRDHHGSELSSSQRNLQLMALAGYLQMRNLILVGQWDPVMRFVDAGELEEIWARLYVLLLRHEGKA